MPIIQCAIRGDKSKRSIQKLKRVGQNRDRIDKTKKWIDGRCDRLTVEKSLPIARSESSQLSDGRHLVPKDGIE